MKQLLTLIILSLLCIQLQSQTLGEDYWYRIDFENSDYNSRLFIDTVAIENNSWEIGKPDKNYFDSSFSQPNAIVTILNGPYPVFDSSVFIIKHNQRIGFEEKSTAFLRAYYKIDSDTLTDFGKIEFSPDNGTIWIDILKDEIQYKLRWYSIKPTLTGTSNWCYMDVDLADLAVSPNYNDTVIFRFTFISDGIDSGRDGLMFDDIEIFDYYESIRDRNQSAFSSKAFPNPGSSVIEIAYDQSWVSACNISIYNTSGKLVYFDSGNSGGNIEINVSGFQGGVYLYRLVDTSTGFHSTGRFVVDL